jgi:hypothetical protein
LRRTLISILCLAGLSTAAPGLAADSLGRLFFTPAQRQALDAGKSLGKAAPAVRGPRSVFLNGVVTRSDAERTVWVNGKAYYDVSPDGVQINIDPAAPGVAVIRAPGANAPVELRVGQRLERATGKISEGQAAAAVGNDTARSGTATESPPVDPSARPPER